MKLYYSPGACSLAVHILLREVAATFTLQRVDTKTHQTAEGVDYYTINPKGSVPVLELAGGERLTEGPIIAQYICDKAGREDLMPAAGSMARYRVMEWQNYVTSEIHKTYSPLFNPQFDAAGKPYFIAALGRKYAWLSSQLADRPFLAGDAFTAADAYLFTVTRWHKPVGLDLSANTALLAYMEQIASRTAVREALQAEGAKG